MASLRPSWILKSEEVYTHWFWVLDSIDNIARSEAGPLDYTLRRIREVAPLDMPTPNL